MSAKGLELTHKSEIMVNAIEAKIGQFAHAATSVKLVSLRTSCTFFGPAKPSVRQLSEFRFGAEDHAEDLLMSFVCNDCNRCPIGQTNYVMYLL